MIPELGGVSISYPISNHNHPFFDGLHRPWSGAKTIYNNVLSFEGDIFKGCQIRQKYFKKVLLAEHLEAASKIEGMSVSQIKPEMLVEARK